MNDTQIDAVESPLSTLKVLVIEDKLDSRGLIKSSLQSFGVKHIDTSDNGADIFAAHSVINYDVIILGYDLGYSHSGTDLMHYLDRLQYLPLWTKFIFITNMPEEVAFNQSFCHLKTEILEKPYHPATLENALKQAKLSLSLFKPYLKRLKTIEPSSLLATLNALSTNTLPATQADELNGIKLRLLLRLGQGKSAWRLCENIKDDYFRLICKLHVARLLGDDKKYTEVLRLHKENGAMDKLWTMYNLNTAILNKDYKEALETLSSVEERRLSPTEIQLKSILLVKTQGIDTAIDYLTAKLGISIENLHFRNIITMSMVKCYMLVCAAGIVEQDEIEDIHEALVHIIKANTWSQGNYNFSAYTAHVKLAFEAITSPDISRLKGEFDTLMQDLDKLPPQVCISLALVAFRLGELENTRLILTNVDHHLIKVTVSPELMLTQIIFDDVFDTAFDDINKAIEYNRLGLIHNQSNLPYRALRMFYQAYQCADEKPAVAINLVNAMVKLDLTQYKDVSVIDIAKKLRLRPLKEKEKLKWNATIKKYKVMQQKKQQAVV